MDYRDCPKLQVWTLREGLCVLHVAIARRLLYCVRLQSVTQHVEWSGEQFENNLREFTTRLNRYPAD